ncbi:unnamed protein product [Amoebophrya sp. A25]|nr:unnamed protein product [Amoebophrya sp. A25]|eukprot:GSA25T00010344001.1
MADQQDLEDPEQANSQPIRNSAPGGTDTDSEDDVEAGLLDGSTGAALLTEDIESMTHWEFYASRKKIPYVTLADYGPQNAFLHFLWSGMVLLGLRFVLPRLDRKFDCSYLYDYWWCFLAWFAVMGIGLSPYLDGTMKPAACMAVMVSTWFVYYIFACGLLAMRDSVSKCFRDRAALLKWWELTLWTAWFGMVVCYVVLNKADFGEVEAYVWGRGDKARGKEAAAKIAGFCSHPATLAAAILLVLVGSIGRMWAAYLSGVNNYHLYDMILDRPNERFVASSLYACIGSPTYVLGYVDGYGLALLAGWRQLGSPTLIFVYTLACHISIMVMNGLVEQPFVREMYLSEKDGTKQDSIMRTRKGYPPPANPMSTTDVRRTHK